ncbi:hypothetical protein [Methylobacterium gossipiicola]|uniref:Uncharacterized protein n=1 Tax=Methylobacterium gossipiicola TaxID=582675 RepID=A0A1I2WYN7_9HYPH|nr:hypothetical protein [Methylobacterium gossipiicola]SFH06403.1 hypothetical protein SAMN05192565_12919 [Methylobacterium gossipiicola]
MGTPRDLKVQMAAETRARERAQAVAKLQTARADKAEAALTQALAERDAWRERALAGTSPADTSDPAEEAGTET